MTALQRVQFELRRCAERLETMEAEAAARASDLSLSDAHRDAYVRGYLGACSTSIAEWLRELAARREVLDVG